MKRIVAFVLPAALVVVGFAFGFRGVQPGWYGDLLFQTCLIFGAIGLVAGFVAGFFARRIPDHFVAASNDDYASTTLEWSHNRRQFIPSTKAASERRSNAAKPAAPRGDKAP